MTPPQTPQAAVKAARENALPRFSGCLIACDCKCGGPFCSCHDFNSIRHEPTARERGAA